MLLRRDPCRRRLGTVSRLNQRHRGVEDSLRQGRTLRQSSSSALFFALFFALLFSSSFASYFSPFFAASSSRALRGRQSSAFCQSFRSRRQILSLLLLRRSFRWSRQPPKASGSL